jgi:hypothetical protein
MGGAIHGSAVPESNVSLTCIDSGLAIQGIWVAEYSGKGNEEVVAVFIKLDPKVSNGYDGPYLLNSSRYELKRWLSSNPFFFSNPRSKGVARLFSPS